MSLLNQLRIGHSKDIHRLIKGEEIILGNVTIATKYQIDAHSDGDVLLHAIAESIIGALGKGDLGTFFPVSSTPVNISSLEILNTILNLMNSEGYQIINIDCLIVCDKIKISPIRDKIKNHLSKLLDNSCINIKATTSEGKHPDFIEASSIIMLMKKS